MTTSPALTPPAMAHPLPTSRREDLTTVAAATWLMIGLFVDGWAHSELTELETFFTPWHALFYSGFTATGLWMLWLVHVRRRSGRALRDAVPPGYGLGVLGLAIFAVGGVGDAIWHTFLGIEVDIDALYSPTHVLLFTGMMLILTSPVRAAWQDASTAAAPTLRDLAPAVGGATLTASMLVFAFMYWSPVMTPWASTAYVTWADIDGIEELALLQGTASLFTSVLLLVGPLALLLRRWVAPRGTATILFTVPTLLASALTAFTFVDLVLAALAAGIVTDLVLARLRPTPARPAALRAATATAAGALVATYLAAVWVTRGIGWAPEFTFGVTVWSTVLGYGLGLLVAPPPLPTASDGLGRDGASGHDVAERDRPTVAVP